MANKYALAPGRAARGEPAAFRLTTREAVYAYRSAHRWGRWQGHGLPVFRERLEALRARAGVALMPYSGLVRTNPETGRIADIGADRGTVARALDNAAHHRKAVTLPYGDPDRWEQTRYHANAMRAARDAIPRLQPLPGASVETRVNAKLAGLSASLANRAA